MLNMFLKCLPFSRFDLTVFSRLSARWQHLSELNENGALDEENTDTQVLAIIFTFLKLCYIQVTNCTTDIHFLYTTQRLFYGP